MNTYGFEVAHGYSILKGVIDALNEEEAKQRILNGDWDDIIDEYDCDVLTEGYEITDFWKRKQ